jgi:HTH-type transcriptional regulator / antitoxin HigA
VDSGDWEAAYYPPRRMLLSTSSLPDTSRTSAIDAMAGSGIAAAVKLHPSRRQVRIKGKRKMASSAKFGLRAKDHDSYLRLVISFPLKSIESDEHLEAASQVIDNLLAQDRLDHGVEMYLDALSDLVNAYEEKNHAIPPASDAEMLRHLLEMKGVTQADLSRETKLPKSSLSEILAGKKPFSRQMIRTLADYFQVDTSILTANFLVRLEFP